MKQCGGCLGRIWPWEARFTIVSIPMPDPEFVFHGECACLWLLAALNRHLRSVEMQGLGEFGWKRVTGWWK